MRMASANSSVFCGSSTLLGRVRSRKSPCFPSPIARNARRPVHTAALLTSRQSDSVDLPLDFYLLLQIPPTARRDSASRAYERALENPPAHGYSPQALAARSTVLRSAMETLVNPTSRRDYDERLQMNNITEEVPAEFVAGTLILLQEAGEAQTVVAAGEAWLATHRRDRSARDVALATALGHCDVARAFLDAHGSVEQAVAMLEVAERVLRHHLAGTPELERQIEIAVSDLQPMLALELVAHPLGDEARRSHGLALLPAVLHAFTESSPAAVARRGSLTRKQLMERLRELLTAAEHVSLLEAAGSAYASSPAELYEAAMAHIAEGCTRVDPSLVSRAMELLVRAEVAAAESAVAVESAEVMMRDRRLLDERHRRAVAICVCSLLLGSTEGAVEALGLREGHPKCDRQVLAFIRANSPDKEDMLPGLCSLAQRWVTDVALNTFRSYDASAPPPLFSLHVWFDEPAVQRFLRGQQGGVLGMLGAAAQRAGALVAAPFKALAAFVAPAQQAAEAADAENEARLRAEHQSREQEEAAAAAAAEAAAARPQRFARQARSAPPASQPAPASAAAVTQPQRAAPAFEAAPANAAAAPVAKPVVQLPGSIAAAQAQADEEEEELEFPAVPVALEAIKPLGGAAEDAWMRSAYEKRELRWGRLVGTAAVLLGGAFLVARAALAALAPLPTAAAAPAATAASAAVPTSTGLTLSRSEASSVVAKWQRIKAAALGPSHATAKLSAALRGDLLQQWQERSAQLRAKGWHYTHSLQHFNVTAVERGAVPDSALVTATFKEGVTVHKGADGPPQSFVSEYSVVYELLHEGGAGWVITGAQVQAA